MSKIRNMEEFASVSGISRPTLSKYFQDPESVRPTTRARIEEALERFDYRPNIYAVNQNRRLTKNVGILVPYLADPFFAEIARNIERRCIDAGFSPTLFSAHGDRRLETDILDTLRAMKPAGVLLATLGRGSDQAAVERFCRDVPTVLFDNRIDGIEATFVGSDNTRVVGDMVDHLCTTGSAPCLFEMATPANPNSNRRRRAYRAAMARHGAEPHVLSVPGEGWDFEEIGKREGRRVLEAGIPTDTLLCSNDRLAIGVLAAAYELGLKVGRDAADDLRVAGLDDHPFARFTCPALTTVAQDYAAISEETVARLLRLVDDEAPATPEPAALFPGKLVRRASA